jgi:hypothetical protein
VTQPPGRSPGRNRPALGLWLLYLIGALEVLFILRTAVVVPAVRGLIVILIGSLVPAIYLAIALHEAGHLLAGHLVGFHFRYVTIGPLKISRQGRRLRLSGAGRRLWFSGFAASLPTDYHDLPRRTAVMIAGGPIASLLQSVVAGAGIAAWFQHFIPFGLRSTAQLAALVPLLSVTGMAVVFLVSILPFRTGGLMTDGAKLLLLWRGGAQAEQYCVLTILAGLALAGVRPREWPAELIARTETPPDAPDHTTSLAMMAYYHALDRGEVEAAAAHLERGLSALEKHPRLFRPAVCLAAAYFTARYRGDAAKAREYLRESKGVVLVEPYARLRTEAAILFAEQNWAAARARATEALAAIESGPPGAAVEAEWLRGVIALAAAREPVSSASS